MQGKSSIGSIQNPGVRLLRKGLLLVFLLFLAMAMLGLFLNMGRLILVRLEDPRSTEEMTDR